jgi:hypothetical protein
MGFLVAEDIHNSNWCRDGRLLLFIGDGWQLNTSAVVTDPIWSNLSIDRLTGGKCDQVTASVDQVDPGRIRTTEHNQE